MTENTKLDLFATIKEIDKKNRNWYENLPEHQQKQANPFLLMQWLSCGNNDDQTVLINEIVNPYVFKLYKHPKLLAKVLTACTTGSSQRYKWISNAKNIRTPNCIDLISNAYDISKKEARTMINVIQQEDILLLAYNYGLQADQIKDIQKELKELYDK